MSPEEDLEVLEYETEDVISDEDSTDEDESGFEGGSDLLLYSLIDVKNIYALSHEEILDQARLVQNHGSIEARNKIVNSHIFFAVKKALEKAGQGLSIYDLIQEAMIGLIKAADKFDPTLGFKFGTYAGWWVRQCIDRAIIDKSKTMRLPVHLHQLILKINRIEYEFKKEHGRSASLEELAEITGKPEKKIKRALQSKKLIDCTYTDSLETVELDDVGDIFSSDPSILALAKSEYERALNDLNSLIDDLSKLEVPQKIKERFLVRYGLDKELKTVPLKKVAKEYNLSPQAIQQSIDGVWYKLKKGGRDKNWLTSLIRKIEVLKDFSSIYDEMTKTNNEIK